MMMMSTINTELINDHNCVHSSIRYSPQRLRVFPRSHVRHTPALDLSNLKKKEEEERKELRRLFYNLPQTLNNLLRQLEVLWEHFRSYQKCFIIGLLGESLNLYLSSLNCIDTKFLSIFTIKKFQENWEKLLLFTPNTVRCLELYPRHFYVLLS